MTPLVHIHRLGKIHYKESWDLQERLLKNAIEEKLKNRNKELPVTPENHILICEHPNVYTLGKSGQEKNLLLNKNELESQSIDYFKINRGGDITYHGPGQLVVYPILDLEQFFTDIHKYMRFLEEAVIQTLFEYGIQGERIDGLTGVWVKSKLGDHRKICAMGVKCSRWVTMHGIGFNVNTDLSYFKNIIPCGIEGKAATSVEQELGKRINIEDLTEKLIEKLQGLFEFKINQA
jgi:lipoyl(octanoyl) transferase